MRCLIASGVALALVACDAPPSPSGPPAQAATKGFRAAARRAALRAERRLDASDEPVDLARPYFPDLDD